MTLREEAERIARDYVPCDSWCKDIGRGDLHSAACKQLRADALAACLEFGRLVVERDAAMARVEVERCIKAIGEVSHGRMGAAEDIEEAIRAQLRELES